jgi:hypothetical protein
MAQRMMPRRPAVSLSCWSPLTMTALSWLTAGPSRKVLRELAKTHALDRAVSGLWNDRGLSGDSRAPDRLGVDGISFAAPPSRRSVRSAHLDDCYSLAAQESGQLGIPQSNALHVGHGWAAQFACPPAAAGSYRLSRERRGRDQLGRPGRRGGRVEILVCRRPRSPLGPRRSPRWLNDVFSSMLVTEVRPLVAAGGWPALGRRSGRPVTVLVAKAPYWA